MSDKEEAVQFFKSILKDVDPVHLLNEIVSWDEQSRNLTVPDATFQIKQGQKVYVIGSGKASATMANALENILGDVITGGFIIVPEGTTKLPSRIEPMEGNHPLPGQKSIVATQKFLSFIKNIPDGSVVINVLSGGTSAMLCLPADNILMEEIQEMYKLLLVSGASIHIINTVRKALSRVKGGRLLDHLRHTTLIDLIISDVPNDDPKFIGSGPTTAQETSYKEAVHILMKKKLWEKIPETVRNYLTEKMQYEQKERHTFYTEDFENHYSSIIASALKVARRLALRLEKAGYRVSFTPVPWMGPIEHFVEHIDSEANTQLKKHTQSKALVFFGECTVKVDGEGKGGRNQELALRVAMRLTNCNRKVVFLSGGTDGIDGPTEAAGAVVDQNTIKKARELGLEPKEYLENNDSYNFFKKAGGHVITGPTGNNLMDLQILLISEHD